MTTRTALLDSAERLARGRGYDGFSYADLSEEVGIRKASIHHHFPTKADLAQGVMQRYRLRFAENLEAISSRKAKGGERLKAYIASYREALANGDTVCLCVAFSAGRESLSEPVLAELSVFEEMSVAWLSEVFRRGLEDGTIDSVTDPRSEATACLALVEGAQLLARAAKDVQRFDAAVATLRNRLR